MKDLNKGTATKSADEKKQGLTSIEFLALASKANLDTAKFSDYEKRSKEYKRTYFGAFAYFETYYNFELRKAFGVSISQRFFDSYFVSPSSRSCYDVLTGSKDSKLTYSEASFAGVFRKVVKGQKVEKSSRKNVLILEIAIKYANGRIKSLSDRLALETDESAKAKIKNEIDRFTLGVSTLSKKQAPKS